MNNTLDLHLIDEILPLFDHTQNYFAKDYLHDIFKTPLQHIDSIKERQDILKSIIKNKEIFLSYQYSKVDFHDAHNLLYDTSLQHYGSKDTIRYYSSKSTRNKTQGNFIQLVFFLEKLETSLFGNLRIDGFPSHYKNDLLLVKGFLSGFRLSENSNSIKKGTFGLSQIRELTHLILKHRKTGDLNTFFDIFFQFEAYISLAKGIIHNTFVFPEIGADDLDIKGMYHPLLKKPVKNDFFTQKNVVLITGANMSGKSTLLKTIGLCIYLGHLGLAIPTSSATMPFYQNISVIIDHNDDMKNGYSHFMNEVQKLKNILSKAQEQESCFAIFDEIFKGTNIDDAQHITAATIQGLAQFKASLFFISTHLHELKELDVIKDGTVDCYYIDCNLNSENLPSFTYTIKSGWSDLKIGQILFANEGLYKLLHNKQNS